MNLKMLLPKNQIHSIIQSALAEDIGKADITTLYTVSPRLKGEAIILAKENGIVCGLDIVKQTFHSKDKTIKFQSRCKEGSLCRLGMPVARVSGNLQSIINCERVALNFLSHLSGIATATYHFVQKVKGTKVKIKDTRKTTPNLRVLEKYAVRIGGGHNHRMCLDDGIMIKDNHLRAGKYVYQGKLDHEKIEKIITALKKLPQQIIVEVENLAEFQTIIPHKPHVIMLDNFSLADIKKAVVIRNKSFPKVQLEASGGINLANVKAVAACGVEYISIGSITHSSKAIDFSLEIM